MAQLFLCLFVGYNRIQPENSIGTCMFMQGTMGYSAPSPRPEILIRNLNLRLGRCRSLHRRAGRLIHPAPGSEWGEFSKLRVGCSTAVRYGLAGFQPAAGCKAAGKQKNGRKKVSFLSCLFRIFFVPTAAKFCFSSFMRKMFVREYSLFARQVSGRNFLPWGA